MKMPPSPRSREELSKGRISGLFNVKPLAGQHRVEADHRHVCRVASVQRTLLFICQFEISNA